MRRPLALVFATAFALARCANPARPAPGTATRLAAADVPVPVTRVVERVDGGCPVVVAGSDVVLARVGPTALTGCDLATAWTRHVRQGDHQDDPRALLQELVRDALLAARDAPGARVTEVDGELAEALVRAEALAALARDLPDEAAVARYYERHRALFERPERAHLREIVLPTEAAARAVHAALAGGTPFEDLVARTISADGRRDGGDLGFTTREGSAGVARAVAEAGFAIPEPGGLAPAPVAAAAEVPARRGRTRRVVTWHVVQLVARVPAETIPLAAARRRIVQRLTRERYETLRRAARERLVADLRPRLDAAIDPRALAAVRLAPAPAPPPAPRDRRRRR